MLSNTIINNAIGIKIGVVPQSVSGNNIYSNAINVKLTDSNSVDLSNNWWGTTDQQAINQSIYDFKNDFNLGTVNFVPYLTSPNTNAPPVNFQPRNQLSGCSNTHPFTLAHQPAKHPARPL